MQITWLGSLIYRLSSSNKSTIMKNIDLVFKNSMTLKEQKHLCKAYFSHIIMSITELLRAEFSNKRSYSKRLEVQGIDHLLNASIKGRGVFLLTAHLGNFEIIPGLFAGYNHDFAGQFHVVRKSLKNSFIDKFLFGRFEKNNVKVINDVNAIKGIKKALSENGAVYFTIDQGATCHAKSTCEIDFLGVKANAYTTIASLAYHWKVPVVPFITYRDSHNKHIVELHPEIKWYEHPDKRIAIIKNTQNYSKTIESFILQHPEQWIWSYNRWKR